MEKGIDKVQKGGEGVIDLADLISDVLEDGKVNLADLPKATRLPGIIGKFTGLNGLGGQLTDIDPVEEDVLRMHFSDYLTGKLDDTGKDDIERKATKALNAAIAFGVLIEEFRK